MRIVHHHWLLALLLTLAVTGCGREAADAGARSGAEAASVAASPTKSPNDDRLYRFVTLDNGLRALLVTDPDADNAAASLTVLRGSWDEPAEYPGLAHFLEHMLFIGTEKYPEVDSYQQFIAANGGSSNAYTAGDHTNYFFDIKPAAFEAALDRLAQFFIAPRLDPAYVEREMNAVNSEFQLQQKDDGWRQNAALKQVFNPDHPLSRFNIGNLDSLDQDGVHEALRRFYETQYSADQMVLVALSNEPLDTLQNWVRERFSAIVDRGIGPRSPEPPLLRDGTLPATFYYRPVKDIRQLSFNFPIPSLDPHYRQKPATYLTNLLGHEGDGSLHQALTERGWIESLSAGTNRVDDGTALLSINIELTAAGEAHREDIGELLFSYVELLKASPPQAWRYAEQARMAELGFRYQEQSSATGFVYRIAPRIARYPVEDLLIAPYLMEAFDGDLIREYLAWLRPDNLLLEVVSPQVRTDREDPWFGAPYRLEAGVGDIDARADTAFALPEPNPYLPADLALVDDDPTGPVQAVDRPGLSLWADADAAFGTPRRNLMLTLGLVDGLEARRDRVLAELHVRLVRDSLADELYPAYLAGMGWDLRVSGSGVELLINGYSDKQGALLTTVLDAMGERAVDADRFAIFKDELRRELGNFRDERPYTQTYAAVDQLLLSSSWPPAALLETLAPLTAKELERWRRSRLGAYSVEGLLHGNLRAEDVDAIAATLTEHLPLKDFELVHPQVATVSRNLLIDTDVDHDDAAMVTYLQDPDAGITGRARSAMAVQLLRQAYFSSLRTEQQLGYVVTVAQKTLRDRAGLAFIVQSPVASPAALDRATADFMTARLEAIEAMSEEAFAEYRDGLVARLSERDKNLNERSRRLWADLELGITSFDSREQLVAAVRQLDRPAMQRYLAELASRLGRERLLAFSRGRFDEVPRRGLLIDSIASFKRSLTPQAPAGTAAENPAAPDRSAE